MRSHAISLWRKAESRSFSIASVSHFSPSYLGTDFALLFGVGFVLECAASLFGCTLLPRSFAIIAMPLQQIKDLLTDNASSYRLQRQKKLFCAPFMTCLQNGSDSLDRPDSLVCEFVCFNSFFLWSRR